MGARAREPSVLTELVPASRSLYLLFGGIAAGIGMPPFEFYRSSAILGESRVFCRDLSQAWYHNGLEGVSTDLPGTAAYLAALVAQCQPERLYFVGNSMGGFAAFLFAHLIGRGHVIMFSPQTFISRLKRLLHGDRRWRREVSATYRATRRKMRCFDLSQLERYSPRVSARVLVSEDARLDLAHARNIARCPNVVIDARRAGGHALVRQLRDSGELPAILRAAER